MEQKEISSIIGVSEVTITAWKKRYNWEERKQIFTESTHATVDKLRRLLNNYVSSLESLDDDKAADKVAKVTAAIEKLDAHFDFLGSVIVVSEEWIGWSAENDDELFALLQKNLPRFLAHARLKYST